jgi:hypothetical protein
MFIVYLWATYKADISSLSDVVSMVYESYRRDVWLYPNPVSDEMTIQTSNLSTLQLINVYGHILKNHPVLEGQNTVNLSEFPSGFLIFVIRYQE